MKRTLSTAVLTMSMLLASLGSAAAADGAARSSDLWLKNVGDGPAVVRLAGTVKNERIALAAGQLAVVAGAGTAQVRTGAGNEVFVLRAPAGLDASGMEFHVHAQATIERQPNGSAQIKLTRPEWVVELISTSAIEGATLRAGQVIYTPVTLGEAPELRATVDATVSFLGPGSVKLRLVGADGRTLARATATAPKALRWRLPLGDLAPEALAGGTRLEIRVQRGEVATAVGIAPAGSDRRLARPVLTHTKVGGTASFTHNINWSDTGDLYYFITGAPASTCGDLVSTRNGNPLFAGGWACTNSSGNATLGPWSWSGTPSDQTDTSLYIDWGASQTNTLNHVWDKSCPTAWLDPAAPGSGRPSTWEGDATDVQWGACFHGAWSEVGSSFYNSNTGKYWNPSVGYNATIGNGAVVYGSLSGAPSCSVGWSTQFPPAGAHVTGHHYYWTTCVTDGDCGSCVNYDFVY
jgi:hypothetical protein